MKTKGKKTETPETKTTEIIEVSETQEIQEIQESPTPSDSQQEIQVPEAISESISETINQITTEILTGQKITKTLESPLKVFPRKDLTGKPQNMGPGSSIIMQKLDIVGPTGTNIFRIKRANSDRTYYTTEEHIPQKA